MKIKVTLIKSPIGRKPDQRRTVAALGLRKMHSSATHEASPSILGMVSKISHLIKVEEMK